MKIRSWTLLLLGLGVLLQSLYLIFLAADPAITAAQQARFYRLLADLSIPAIDRLLLERPEQKPIEIQRQSGAWFITRPKRARADQALVAEIIGQIEFLASWRELAPASRQRLGLALPRLRLTICAGKQQTELLFGQEDPSGRGVYLARGQRVFLVEASFFQAVNQGLDELRSSQLFSLAEGQVQKILIRRSLHEELRLTLAKQEWYVMQQGATPQRHIENRRASQPEGIERRPGAGVTRPPAGRAVTPMLFRADPQKVRRLLRAALNLRPVRFLPQQNALPPQQLTIQGQGHAEVLYFGRPCPGQENEILLAWYEEQKQPSYGCVDQMDLEVLSDWSAGEMIDRALTRYQEPELKRIRITQGEKNLELSREGGSWQMGDGSAAQGELIARWLEQLRSYRLDPVSTSQTALYPQQALVRSPMQIALTPEHGHGEQLMLEGEKGDRVIIRRNTEPSRFRIPAAAKKLWQPDALRFLHRGVLHFSPFAVRRVITARGLTREVLIRDPRTWRISEPVKLPADIQQVEQLLSRASKLEAIRFLDPAEVKALARPLTTVYFYLQEEQLLPQERQASKKDSTTTTLTLSLGPLDDEGSCFGRIKEQPPFLLDGKDCRLLQTFRGSRQLFSGPEEQWRRIILNGPQGRFQLEKQGFSWHYQNKRGLVRRASELLEYLGQLQAEQIIEYSSPRGSILWQVELQSENGTHQILSGNKEGHCFIKDRPVTYAIAPLQIEKIWQLVEKED